MDQATEQTKRPMTRDEILIAWQQAKDALTRAMHNELHYRLQVVKEFFPDVTNDTEGTQNVELGNGYKLKATFKLNYNLGKRDDVDVMLDEIEKTGPEGAFIAKRIVNWSPALSLTEYRDLEPEFKTIVDKQLTIKPGLPSIEIVEPK